MSQQKILKSWVGIAILAGLIHLGWTTFYSPAGSKKDVETVEAALEVVSPKTSTQSQDASQHLFYISTPLGSVGIL